eukprot:CAMPEP_0185847632 /NCGR_PEP_ID=MMETSP1354-20130828/2835_1 /TAXON_ID=708628 /ORGANISM="Erythrolobus madagascarensis, Strain CCMP3276" /LENGTH=207 /DNA_ID=CAMNT_0028547951 /DNA_START=156 /DNA_END=779 /DNA_ORIENTATION=-
MVRVLMSSGVEEPEEDEEGSVAVEIKQGDVVLLARAYGEVRVAVVDSVDSSCVTADVIVMEEFRDGLYVPDKREKNSFERVSKMTPLPDAVRDKDGVRVSPEAVAAAAATLRSTTTSSPTLQRNRELDLSSSGRADSPFTRRGALVAAAVSVPSSAVLYALHSSMTSSFSDPTSAEQLLLLLTLAASVLTLFIGSCLLLWAAIAPQQ